METRIKITVTISEGTNPPTYENFILLTDFFEPREYFAGEKARLQNKIKEWYGRTGKKSVRAQELCVGKNIDIPVPIKTDFVEWLEADIEKQINKPGIVRVGALDNEEKVIAGEEFVADEVQRDPGYEVSDNEGSNYEGSDYEDQGYDDSDYEGQGYDDPDYPEYEESDYDPYGAPRLSL